MLCRLNAVFLPLLSYEMGIIRSNALRNGTEREVHDTNCQSETRDSLENGKQYKCPKSSKRPKNL